MKFGPILEFHIYSGLQVGPSGHRTLFVDIKSKLLSQYKLLTKAQLLFQCQPKVVLDQMEHPVQCTAAAA